MKYFNYLLLASVLSLITCQTSYAQKSLKDTLAIDEVVVTGTRNAIDVRLLPMSVSVISGSQIEKRFEQSLLPILSEQVPSLFTTARGIMGYGVSTGASGGISMRGIGSNPTTGMLILIDGHPQYMGLMGHPIADAYQSMLADKVEVVRGPASVLYGSNAMGGVVNIITKKDNTEGFKGGARVAYGSYNTLNSEINGRYYNNGFTSLITCSYNRTDGHRKNMEFEQYGGYAKVGYEFSDFWNAFVDLNLTHYNASNPGMVSKPIIDNDSRITRGMTSVSIENNYAKTSGALKFFYNFGRHKINDGYYEGQKPLDYIFNSKDNMLGISWYQNATFFTGNRVTLGVDYQRFGGKAWNALTNGNRADIIDKHVDDVAGYINMSQAIKSILTLDAGVRFDHHSVTGNHWIPQFGASIYPTNSAEIKLQASRGFRNPTIREMYMFPPQNPNLQPESLWNYEISWSQRLFHSRLSYGLNLFFIKGKNMIQVVPVNGRPLNINTGEIRNWGIEATSSYRLNKEFTLMANYSFLHMKYVVIAAPQHKLYIGGDFTKNKWSASTGIQYINGLYTSTKPIITENYLLWNMRGSYQALSWLQIFARVENILDQKYEINLGFPMPGITAMGGLNINI